MHALLFILLLLMPLYLWWWYRRRKAMIAEWAAANRFTLLEAKQSFFPPLRLWLTTSREQVVMRVKVYDESTHRIREGWLRLGSYWWGLFDADAIEVRWENE